MMRRGAGAGDAEKSSSSGAAGGAGGATGISSKGLSADSVLRNIDEEPPSARAAHGDPLFPKDLGGGSMGVRDLETVPQSAPSLASPHGDARQPLFRDVVPPPEVMSSAKAGSGGVAGAQQKDVLGSGSGFPGQPFGSGRR